MAKKPINTAAAVKAAPWPQEDPEKKSQGDGTKKDEPEKKKKERHNLLLVEDDFRDFQTYARARGTSANAMINEFIKKCVRDNRENAELIETIRKFRNDQDT